MGSKHITKFKEKVMEKTSVEPVEINVALRKTIQEREYEPFSASVALKAKILPNEVSSEFQRIYEVLDEELVTILNTRLEVDAHGPRPQKKTRHLRKS